MSGKIFLICCYALFTASRALAIDPIVIDWTTDAEGNAIVAGQIIDDEYASWGVTVDAVNNFQPFDLAIAFDSQNPTGGDADLGTGTLGYHPTNTVDLGNVLILAENNTDANSDGHIDDPDDQAGTNPGYIDIFFDFVAMGGNMTILDMEGTNTRIDFFFEGALLDGVSIYSSGLGDNSVEVVNFGNYAFDHLRFYFEGSGAIAELEVMPVPEPTTVILLGAASAAAFHRRRQSKKA